MRIKCEDWNIKFEYMASKFVFEDLKLSFVWLDPVAALPICTVDDTMQ